ncbi:MAG: hypothetical protein KF784_15835 [Fimbriimonadaceae bacterium]|nr:hypothetical protein [Fimbriimonadaceae bacterium]
MIKTISSILAACTALVVLALSASQVGVGQTIRPQESILGPQGASLKYKGSCGFAKSGSYVYVVNDRTDEKVQVTIRKSWREGGKSGQEDIVRNLAAGMEQELGCTKSEHIPVTSYQYAVVGVRVGGR